MKEPKLYYTGHDRHDIRDSYPTFYYAMLKFIKSLPDTWYFKRCDVVEYDGSLKTYFVKELLSKLMN